MDQKLKPHFEGMDIIFIKLHYALFRPSRTGYLLNHDVSR
jgi:hypothetical protein